MKKKYIILISLAIIIAGGLVIGLSLYFKPHKNFATSKADFVLSPKQLYDEFDKNEADATKKFVTGDKTVQVSGFVVEINIETDSTTTMLLADSATTAGILSCSFMKSENENLSKIKKSDRITAKGQCTGFQGLIDKSVIMIRCAIAEEK